MNLRTKLLLSYLLFVFLGCIHVQIALWLYEGYKEANIFAQHFQEIRVKTQQNIAQSQHFLLYETLNPHFFETKKSNILTNRDSTVIAIDKNLEMLKNSPLSKSENLILAVDTLDFLLQNYEDVFYQ